MVCTYNTFMGFLKCGLIGIGGSLLLLTILGLLAVLLLSVEARKK